MCERHRASSDLNIGPLGRQEPRSALSRGDASLAPPQNRRGNQSLVDEPTVQAVRCWTGPLHLARH
jgi:hypothetical protein